jgi:hypothetical protein
MDCWGVAEKSAGSLESLRENCSFAPLGRAHFSHSPRFLPWAVIFSRSEAQPAGLYFGRWNLRILGCWDAG